MNTTADRIFTEVLQGIYTAPPGVYTPTLVVGVGGSGVKVLRNLKRNLSRSQEQYVRLLAIDSDEGENERYPGLPVLRDGELVLLDQSHAVRFLACAAQGMRGYEHVREFLPDRHGALTGVHQRVRDKIQTNKGAGQFRRAGKLLFCANVSNGANLDARFREIRNDLVGLGTILDKQAKGIQVGTGCRVYVVGGAGGGTGAGCVPDCLALVRKHFGGTSDIVTALCLLPGDALDKELMNPSEEKPNTRGNAIGLLRELQAFLLGRVGRHTFVFDEHTSYEHTGVAPLVNDVYLMESVLWDGTAVETWMDVCQGAAYFLYGLMGTGVGAAQAAGAVNGNIGDGARQEAVPRVFSTLGVGLLEYPVEELSSYAVRSALDELLGQLLAPARDGTACEALVTQTKVQLGVTDLGALRGTLGFSASEVPEARYAPTTGEKDQLLALEDEMFILRGAQKMDSIEAVLKERYETRFEDRVREIAAKDTATVERCARLLVTGSQAQAARHFALLQQQLKDLQAAFGADHNGRQDKVDRLKAEIERLKKGIRFWDWPLDRGLRRTFLVKVNEYLDLSLRRKQDEYLVQILAALVQTVNRVAATVVNIGISFEGIQRTNRGQMEQAVRESVRRGVAQTAMAASDFEAWRRRTRLPIRRDFEASRLDAETILREALQDVEPELRRSLDEFDLAAQIANDTHLSHRLAALNTASQPFLRLVETAPAEAALVPQKYAVAACPVENDTLFGRFAAPGGGSLRKVQGSNRHMVMCLQTRHGIAASHWGGFQMGHHYYRQKEWYYGSLPDSVRIPALETPGDESQQAVRLLGLGLMLGAIVVRGNRYYANLLFSERDRCVYYLTHRDDAEGTARDLIGLDLICNARKAKGIPCAEHQIATSLAAALDEIQEGKWVPLCEAIRNVMKAYVEKAGQAEVSRKIRAYVEEGLDRQLATGRGDPRRRDVVDQIAQGLKHYAGELG